jgi:hypothetical protein
MIHNMLGCQQRLQTIAIPNKQKQANVPLKRLGKTENSFVFVAAPHSSSDGPIAHQLASGDLAVAVLWHLSNNYCQSTSQHHAVTVSFQRLAW